MLNTSHDLRLLHDNADVWLFEKPAGLAVQGGKGVSYSFEDLIKDSLDEKPYLVHRLDKDTAGILLVAKSSSAASKYSNYFKSKGRAVKLYKTIVSGNFSKTMEITDKVYTDKGLQTAHTSAKLIKQYGKFSLVQLQLHTGRMHQIRQHLSKQGFFIVGDDKYGNFDLNRELTRQLKANGQELKLMLYASQLTIKEEGINISLELPSYFKELLKN
ncbi:MAG: RNA pseudouridine synthase [Spirochaetaceae bacterium]|nr:RNA pseudouridine synthase [Spirochaetaceae bacterium]